MKHIEPFKMELWCKPALLLISLLLVAKLDGTLLKTQKIQMKKSSIPLHIKNRICSIAESAICVSSLRAMFADRFEFIALGRLLGSLKNFNRGRLFSNGGRCNATMTADINEFLETFGSENKGTLFRDVSINIIEIKTMFSCYGTLSARRRSSRIARNLVSNSSNTICFPFWRGDGYCDLGCNTAEFDYDDGDCCYKTCKEKVRRYPCGFTGFQCRTEENGRPNWSNDIKLCFKWKANGVKDQCDNEGKGKICAPIGSMTRFYYDDTDNRNGGCRLSWMIEAKKAPAWFSTRLQLCLYSYPELRNSQCNYGRPSTEVCRRSNNWLNYVDDSDSRPGGCILSWKMQYLGIIYCFPFLLLL